MKMCGVFHVCKLVLERESYDSGSIPLHRSP
ncbi:unnamed protein product [Spirodela intermedia]|uniref:Uncharacterized protein n=1 Tax=Spirodela intermedia TaxID=51605 RepID=A0A7I8LIK2_SPIIN|nr:unnamed protein product [Spirodela intermedia]